MIDRLVSARGRDVFSDDYSPQQAIQSQELINPDAQKLAVIFPPWHGGGRFTDRLSERLQNRNWAVLNYNFHNQIIEPNPNRVLASYETVQAEISVHLDEIQAGAAYRYMHFIGISLGNVAMALVAKEYPDFSSATFVVPGSNLATSMWEGARTQGIAESMEQQGHTKSEVDEAWRDLAPMNNAVAFREKRVQTFISTTDRIILPHYQSQMNEALINAGSHLTSQSSRLGHGASIIKFCYFSGKI